MKLITILCAGILFIGVVACSKCGAANEERQKPTVIVIIGAAGTNEYGAQFAEWARIWEQACPKGDAKFIAIGLDKIEASDDRTKLQDGKI